MAFLSDAEFLGSQPSGKYLSDAEFLGQAPDATVGESLYDLGLAGVQGVSSLVGGAAFLGNKLGIGDGETAREAFGFTKFLEEQKSAEQQAQNKEVAQADGFWDATKTLAARPGAIGDIIAQSAALAVPGAGMGALAARGLAAAGSRGIIGQAIASKAATEGGRAALAATGAAAGARLGESSASAGMMGNEAFQTVMEADLAALRERSPGFAEREQQIGTDAARAELADRVSTSAAGLGGIATLAGGVLAGRANKLIGLEDAASPLARALSPVERVKAVGGQVVEEGLQGALETPAENYARQQVDDRVGLTDNLGKNIATGMAGAIGQAGSMQAAGSLAGYRSPVAPAAPVDPTAPAIDQLDIDRAALAQSIGLEPAPTVADIGKATSVDEAIAKAQAVLDSAPAGRRLIDTDQGQRELGQVETDPVKLADTRVEELAAMAALDEAAPARRSDLVRAPALPNEALQQIETIREPVLNAPPSEALPPPSEAAPSRVEQYDQAVAQLQAQKDAELIQIQRDSQEAKAEYDNRVMEASGVGEVRGNQLAEALAARGLTPDAFPAVREGYAKGTLSTLSDVSAGNPPEPASNPLPLPIAQQWAALPPEQRTELAANAGWRNTKGEPNAAAVRFAAAELGKIPASTRVKIEAQLGAVNDRPSVAEVDAGSGAVPSNQRIGSGGNAPTIAGSNGPVGRVGVGNELAAAPVRGVGESQPVGAAGTQRGGELNVAQPRQVESQAAQAPAAQVPAAKRKYNPKPDATVDTAMQFIAKNGGIDSSDPLANDLRASLGIDPGKNQRVSGLRQVFARKGAGMSVDDAAGLLWQAGYLPAHDATDMINRLYDGDLKSISYDYSFDVEQDRPTDGGYLSDIDQESAESSGYYDAPAAIQDEVDRLLAGVIDADKSAWALQFYEDQGSQLEEQPFSEYQRAFAAWLKPRVDGRREGQGARDSGENLGGGNTQETSPSFSLEGETEAEAKQRVEAESARLASESREQSQADEAARQSRIQREIAQRQEGSADNFQLGQDAEDGLSGQRPLFSRKGQSTAQYIAAFWKLLSQDVDTFKYGRPTGFDLDEIAKEIDPAMRVRDESSLIPASERKRIAKTWAVEMPDGKPATITENPKGEIWIDASKLGKGVSGGTKLYAMVSSYAAANGKTFIGDPDGLSEAALIRRTENMVSAALRDGTTRHLMPHERQMDPDGYRQSELNQYIRPINWIPGDDANNLEELLLSSYHNVKSLAPEIDRVSYNFTDGGFERDGKPVDREFFEELSRRVSGELQRRGLSGLVPPGASVEGSEQAGGVLGVTTLKRAALTASVAREARGQRWGAVLARLGEQLSGQRLDKSLQKILYSRNDREAERYTTGYKAERLRLAISQLRAKWKNAPQVRVVQSVADARSQSGEEIPDDAEGFYLPGSNTVYLIADNITDRAHGERVLLHEVTGHAGLRGVFGERLNLLMSSIYSSNDKVKAAADRMIQRYGYSKALAVEEALADMAADGALQDQSFWQRLVATVRDMLRRAGFTVEMSENDIRGMLAESRRYVENGGRRAIDADAALQAEPAMSRNAKAKPAAYSEQPNSDSFKAWSGNGDVVSDQDAASFPFKTGKNVVVQAYHGTQRPDRLGDFFNPKRATSGPMAYFTSDPAIASNYAKGKSDTSLYGEDAQYVNWFKFKPAGSRSTVSIDRAWAFLPSDVRQTIAERMPDIRTDDDGNIIYEKGGGDIGSYEWELSQTKRGYDRAGNPLKAAAETWLNSGALFGDEERFMRVLELAGMPKNSVEYDSPNAAYPFVYKTWVSLKKPLVTDDVPQYVADRLAQEAAKDRSRAKPDGADVWDKNTRTLKEWEQEFAKANNSGSFVWTSIPDKVTAVLKDMGFDGIIDVGGKMGGQPHQVYIPFDSTQVKSALGNKGTFDPSKKSILFSRSGQSEQSDQTTLELPDETKADALQRKAQDKFNRFAKLQEMLAEMAGAKVDTSNNVYKAEERYYGRVASRMQDFRTTVVEPIFKAMAEAKVSRDQVTEYLKVMHAKERNAQVRKINPGNPAGSGISDADADERIAAIKADPKYAAIKKAADAFQAITKSRLDMMLKAGIIDQKTYDNFQKSYSYYVPLKNDEEMQGAGMGFSVNGKEKRALGRSTEAQSPIEHILRDYERGVIAVEKNTVGQFLLKLINDNKDQLGKLMTIGLPDKKQVLVSDKAYDVIIDGKVDASFDNAEDAAEYALLNKGGVQTRMDSRVQMRASPQLQENEAVVYLNGQPVRIQFRDNAESGNLLAQQYKNLGLEHMGSVGRVFQGINQNLSKMYTGYNPEFLFKNIIRDATSGMVNLTGTEGLKVAAKAIANYPKAFKESVAFSMRGGIHGNSKIAQDMKEYRANGGSTGPAWLSDIEREAMNLEASLDNYTGAMELVAQGKGFRAAKTAIRKTLGRMISIIEHLNAGGENAFRLAAYISVRDARLAEGASQAEAQADGASAAKNVTVNFNRKGEITPQLAAAYLFFNPAVQGSATMYRSLTKGKNKGQAWAMLGGMATLGVLSRLAFDDDDWEKIPKYTREHNFLIPRGKDDDGRQLYVSVPLPYGHGWFANIGSSVGDVMAGKDKSDAAWSLAQAFVANFSPVGSPMDDQGQVGKGIVNIAPTMFAMAARPLVNVSGFGSELYPESQNSPNKPDNEKVYRGTKGTLYDQASQTLSENIGEKYRNDWADVSPETIKYWTSTLTGGTGRFLFDSAGLAGLAAGGADIEAKDVPVLRTVVNANDVRGARSQFYERTREAKVAADAYRAAIKANDAMERDRIFTDEKPLIMLSKLAGRVQDMVAARRDAQDAINRGPGTAAEKRLKLRELELAEEKLYQAYDKEWDRMRGKE